MALKSQSKEAGGGGVGRRGVEARCRQSKVIPRYIKESSPRKCDACSSERARPHICRHESLIMV